MTPVHLCLVDQLWPLPRCHGVSHCVESSPSFFCKNSSQLKAVSVGCQGRQRQRPVDHFPHVSFRLISGMPSLASEHNQRVHYYTTTGWNVLSTQVHFGLPVFWASLGRGSARVD